uniref:Uncharacterized protein n=1 Tax=Anguilla anguilla TaxID=7936 RepID=A0A0E9XKG4_ANGAN
MRCVYTQRSAHAVKQSLHLGPGSAALHCYSATEGVLSHS